MRWYRSLYFRIALGVVGLLAAMLVVQAMLFTWAVSQSGRSLPGQSPARLGLNVALDLSNVLERDPQTDLQRYIHDQYAQYTHPFFVLLADGRVIADGPTTELLTGGWYFATETARILGGAGGALLPSEGAELLRRQANVELVL